MAKKPFGPRNWRRLERHPLSAEYPDLSGAAAENMREGIRKHGVLNGRKVTIYEGKVLDGWQMYSACVAEGVKPQFQPLPRGVQPEEFVEIVNDHRRHETQEMAQIRIGARRKQAAEMRANGESTHAIAEKLGVSQTTVLNDLEAEGVEAPERIRGRDGRTYAREPGDDSAQVNAEKSRKNGHVLAYDWIPWSTAYGSLVRQVEQVHKAFGAPREGPAYHGLRRQLEEFKAAFRTLHDQLKKAAKER